MERGRRREAAIGADGVAFGERDHVANDEVGGGDVHHLSVAQHGGVGGAEAAEGGDRLDRLRFLPVADAGVEDHDRGDDDHLERGPVGTFTPPRHE